MDYDVIIPEEVFAVLEWERDDLPAICVVNQSLAKFEPKPVFAWHLSIIIDCVELAGQGMPTPAEVEILDGIGDELDEALKADGNALFLARIIWDGTRQLLYRVYDPEVANRHLLAIIDHGPSAREFEFRMEHDEVWSYAADFLTPWAD